MRDDADDYTVARHLEACLLWLFGYVMFCGSQGEAVSRYLIPHAQLIADANMNQVPQISWGSAGLAVGMATGPRSPIPRGEFLH
jgi:hypothetical protein